MKLNKLFSSVLAASLIVSCCAMNAFAASKAHTITINAPEKAVQGETIVVELTMDNTEALTAVEYVLSYDAAAFTADNTKVSRVEKCIDKTWLDGIKDTDGDWGYYLGAPTYNVKSSGLIQFQWAGSEAVEADYAVDNRVIGKFNLDIPADAANGTYTFSLTGKTMDAGENSMADMVCESVTVKVGEDAPIVPDPEPEEKAATISTPVAGKDMYEMKTALTKIAFKSVENPVVRLYKDGEESKYSKEGYELPSNIKGGATEIIGIIRYAADVKGEFVLKVFDGETEIDKATYVAE